MCINAKKSKKKIFCKPKRKEYQTGNFGKLSILFSLRKIKGKITLVKNEEIISDYAEVPNIISNYFLNIVKNLKIPEKFVTEKLPQSLSRHPTLNVILKYKNDPSMHVIKRFSQRFSSFYFSHVDKNIVLKEIKKLNLNKAVQDSDISVKILKENTDFFADYIYIQFNEAVDSSKFADFFKSANL